MKTIHNILQDLKARNSAINRMIKYTPKKSKAECWNWQGHCNKKGYAMLSIGGRKGLYARVSRLAYYFEYGPFDESLKACHTCDNPQCVNPNHIFLGTSKDNTDDMYKKGRESLPPNFYGEEVKTAKLTEEQVLEIYNSNLNTRELSELYNVSATQIHRILTGKSWAHLNLKPKQLKHFIPEPKRELSDEDVRYIRNSKERNVELAKQFNCDASHIGKIKKFKARKDII